MNRDAWPIPTSAGKIPGLWLDDMTWDRVCSGDLAALAAEGEVAGVTIGPAFFESPEIREAPAAGCTRYARSIALSGESALDPQAVFAALIRSVGETCRVLRPLFEATTGRDGWVCLPAVPDDESTPEALLQEVRRLHRSVGEPNLCVGLPATLPGLQAMESATAEGITTKVGPIFDAARYRGAVYMYLAGVRQAQKRKVDLSTMHPVATLSLGAFGAAVDARLYAIGTPAALELIGRAGLAGARMACAVFRSQFGTGGSRTFPDSRANPLRPLWDFSAPDRSSLGSETGRPMDFTTSITFSRRSSWQAGSSSTWASTDPLVDPADDADSPQEVFRRISTLGISLSEVVAALEAAVLQARHASWEALLHSVERAFEAGR
ncbi:hypothetical protein LO771_27710 [Streptacidiphilus sp. ASG 303]|uniref:transaldolase family protein n=1 Tax=Streptacidiphilus sp. ASG 303 TaxID=2896847 RepID=UPI001E5F0573|nr:transaldolase family protein [Streptacidiphilus sp. ASG 303]MCD0486068.1 hypothetical protein [Streptacidiphilus sp. ASG 303]